MILLHPEKLRSNKHLLRGGKQTVDVEDVKMQKEVERNSLPGQRAAYLLLKVSLITFQATSFRTIAAWMNTLPYLRGRLLAFSCALPPATWDGNKELKECGFSYQAIAFSNACWSMVMYVMGLLLGRVQVWQETKGKGCMVVALRQVKLKPFKTPKR